MIKLSSSATVSLSNFKRKLTSHINVEDIFSKKSCLAMGLQLSTTSALLLVEASI